MADYQKMYHTLLLEMNDTINRFQKILYETESIYINTEHDTISASENSKGKIINLKIDNQK